MYKSSESPKGKTLYHFCQMPDLSKPLLMAASAKLGCAWEGISCLLRSGSTSTGSGTGQQKAQGTPISGPTYQWPVRLSHWKILQQYASCMRQVLSHQVGMGAVHQVDTDLNLTPVLGLQPLNKSLRVPQSQTPPSWGLETFIVKQRLKDSSG